MRQIIFDDNMLPIINKYYENNAKKLHTMVDRVLFKLKFDFDKEDVYSLATEIFVNTLQDYDFKQSFDNFFYSCLDKKLKSEMTRRNRKKRRNVVEIEDETEDGSKIVKKVVVSDVSIFEHTSSDCTQTWNDVISNKSNVEDNILPMENLSYKMQMYIKRLSLLQREVLVYLATGYEPNEIKKLLFLTDKQYNDCYSAIKAYRNIKVLY